MHNDLLSRRKHLTDGLLGSPYDAQLYIERALCHQELGFPDLAAGDAYKALLLTDEIQDDSGEYHEQALEALEQSSSSLTDEAGPMLAEAEDGLGGSSAEVANRLALRAYVILIKSLSACGCLRSAFEFCTRGLRLHPDSEALKVAKEAILHSYKQSQGPATDTTSDFDPLTDLPDSTFVRREVYPWSTHEPDRCSDSNIAFLNSELSTIAPKLSARAVSLPLLSLNNPQHQRTVVKQLGLYANADISPGEAILHESSLLTANNRLYDPLCDACCAELPPISPAQETYTCPECDDTVFCSAACLDAAMAGYHTAVCGTDVDAVCRDTEPKEAADALYLLLVARAVAMAQARDTHPLELAETRFLWGELTEANAAPTLPFSFRHNILYPMHVLEKMGLDVYAALDRYDTWVLNTLFAKFRGVASGRVDARTGTPEVCAVHPLWCLANHSCAPNVKWEWGGEIRFWARKEEEVVRWGKGKGGWEGWKGGIRKGEEILNHYCDVELEVKERREWAKGALGGLCMCERCIWEAGGEKNGGQEKA